MVFKGIQKISLIDYPHKICAVVFTGGCNFRCHYCHNPELVLDYEKLPDIPDQQGIDYLSARKGFVDALCIGGGEPTLHKELPEFIGLVKEMGFLVKLDTNGTAPEVLSQLIEKRQVDYIAMDIKATPQKYCEVTGVEPDISRISTSIEIIISSGINYEFRTTVFPEFFTADDAIEISKWITSHKDIALYVLQQPKVIKMLDGTLKSAKLYSNEELLGLAKLLPNCIVR